MPPLPPSSSANAVSAPSARPAVVWRVRTLSGLALGLPVLALTALGAPFFDVLVALCTVVLAWEWARLCGGRGRPEVAALAVAVSVPVLSVGLAGAHLALLLLVPGLVLVGAVAVWRLPRGMVPWQLLGVLYIAVPAVALVWLRAVPDLGLALLLWLLAVVWSTDVGAYVVGRLLGGPRLAPRISPNKTWAGLLGGLGSAVAAGTVAALLVGPVPLVPWVPAAAVAVSLATQIGDLLESGIKRRFGVKDSSQLIPGHGGLLDRVDGLLAAATVMGPLVSLSLLPL